MCHIIGVKELKPEVVALDDVEMTEYFVEKVKPFASFLEKVHKSGEPVQQLTQKDHRWFEVLNDLMGEKLNCWMGYPFPLAL